MTEKLYWTEPASATFETRGASVGRFGERPSVVLDRTLFYPEGGGQLGDAGTLEIAGETVAVLDTQIDEAGTIHHLVARAPGALDADVLVRGTIDAARRRDHTAQHTAQHALSRALADEARADTVSARLGATACTVDVQRASIPDLELHRAEDLVNAIVADNVVVRALYPSPDELAALPLRRAPKVTAGIRVIAIGEFDLTPCGGTHCARTGELGQVRIVGIEKYKGMSRLTFHAGGRALADARRKHETLARVASDLTCGLSDVPAAVGKLRAELKAARALLDGARAEIAGLVARSLLASVPTGDDPPHHVLTVVRAHEDAAVLRALAGKLAEHPRVLAVVAGHDAGGEVTVVVQRGAAVTVDCGGFIQSVAATYGGRGGGRPERAEARFPKGADVAAMVAQLSPDGATSSSLR